MASDNPTYKYKWRAFVPDIPLPRSKFSSAEINLLLKHGSWYEDICNGKVMAVTVAQQRFLACASEKAMPTTPHELVWTRYLQARKEALRSVNKEAAVGESGGVEVWNQSSYDEIIATQKAAAVGNLKNAHQFTGGVGDQNDENYDYTAIK